MLQVADIAARFGPSVVGLGRGWGRGSGIVVAANRVLTNAHVLRGPDVAVAVGGQLVAGRALAADPKADLAIVAADTGNAAPAEFAPRAARIGDLVYALADPGGRGLRVTHGHVAAEPRPAIEHTAPLPRGASGSPLLDAEGRLLGLNTVRAEGGFVLAVPVTRARAEALARGELPRRTQLGVVLTRGLTVRAIRDASPAAIAGVAPGDRLLGVDDRPLRSLDDLLDALEREPADLVLTVTRGGEQRDITLKLQ